jgi:hypothetical protein
MSRQAGGAAAAPRRSRPRDERESQPLTVLLRCCRYAACRKCRCDGRVALARARAPLVVQSSAPSDPTLLFLPLPTLLSVLLLPLLTPCLPSLSRRSAAVRSRFKHQLRASRAALSRSAPPRLTRVDPFPSPPSLPQSVPATSVARPLRSSLSRRRTCSSLSTAEPLLSRSGAHHSARTPVLFPRMQPGHHRRPKPGPDRRLELARLQAADLRARTRGRHPGRPRPQPLLLDRRRQGHRRGRPHLCRASLVHFRRLRPRARAAAPFFSAPDARAAALAPLLFSSLRTDPDLPCPPPCLLPECLQSVNVRSVPLACFESCRNPVGALEQPVERRRVLTVAAYLLPNRPRPRSLVSARALPPTSSE